MSIYLPVLKTMKSVVERMKNVSSHLVSLTCSQRSPQHSLERGARPGLVPGDHAGSLQVALVRPTQAPGVLPAQRRFRLHPEFWTQHRGADLPSTVWESLTLTVT